MLWDFLYFVPRVPGQGIYSSPLSEPMDSPLDPLSSWCISTISTLFDMASSLHLAVESLLCQFLGHFLVYLHWYQCYLVVSMEGGEFRIFYFAGFLRNSLISERYFHWIRIWFLKLFLRWNIDLTWHKRQNSNSSVVTSKRRIEKNPHQMKAMPFCGNNVIEFGEKKWRKSWIMVHIK